jgi:hypothetical protein
MSNRQGMSTFDHDVPWQEPADIEACGGTALLNPPLVNLQLGPHEVELAVWRELQSDPSCHFSTLIVRRLPDGICLQGVLETEDANFLADVDSRVKRVACVNRVLTQLVVRACRTAE